MGKLTNIRINNANQKAVGSMADTSQKYPAMISPDLTVSEREHDTQFPFSYSKCGTFHFTPCDYLNDLGGTKNFS